MARDIVCVQRQAKILIAKVQQRGRYICKALRTFPQMVAFYEALDPSIQTREQFVVNEILLKQFH